MVAVLATADHRRHALAVGRLLRVLIADKDFVVVAVLAGLRRLIGIAMWIMRLVSYWAVGQALVCS